MTPLFHFLAFHSLSGDEKSSYQFILAADYHAGKFPEPLSLRHIGLRIQPLSQESQLVGGDLPFLDAIQKVFEQRTGKMIALNLRHG